MLMEKCLPDPELKKRARRRQEVGEGKIQDVHGDDAPVLNLDALSSRVADGPNSLYRYKLRRYRLYHYESASGHAPRFWLHTSGRGAESLA